MHAGNLSRKFAEQAVSTFTFKLHHLHVGSTSQSSRMRCLVSPRPSSAPHLPTPLTGVGDSLVEFAKAKGVDMVAVGSRGMGSVKRSLMSLVGLGSVSDYVLHQLHVPVLVVHAGQGAAAAAAATPAEGQVGWLVWMGVDG